MSVLEFKRPDKVDPHITGEAVCFCCKYVWIAVAPIGTEKLQCPNCNTMKGLFKHGCYPDEGTVWGCACGNDLFVITPERIICWNCGATQVFPLEDTRA